MEVTLNPGFALIAAALLVLALPMAARAPAMVAAGFAAMWLLLEPEFGAAGAVAQMGLAVVPRTLDELNQVFGIAFIAAAIMIALYSSARRNRYEDAAIMLLAGSTLTALFVGDLVSFIAATALAGLASAWVVFASPEENAGAAGARLLIWCGLEGLLFLAGVAFHVSSGAEYSVLALLRVDQIGGAFIFAALMIRVGAPLAHVWVKDAIGHASSTGAPAISAFTSLLGVYAIARLFEAEPLLIPIGAAMIILGAFYAAAEDDPRRAGAYGLIAQTGLCVALMGIGSPLALAGAVAHAFTVIIAFVLLQMALGAMHARIGSVRLSALAGASRAMPITVALMFVGGAAASGVPGLATYASLAVALEAAGAMGDSACLGACGGIVGGAVRGARAEAGSCGLPAGGAAAPVSRVPVRHVAGDRAGGVPLPGGRADAVLAVRVDAHGARLRRVRTRQARAAVRALGRGGFTLPDRACAGPGSEGRGHPVAGRGLALSGPDCGAGPLDRGGHAEALRRLARCAEAGLAQGGAHVRAMGGDMGPALPQPLVRFRPVRGDWRCACNHHAGANLSTDADMIG